MSCYIAIQNFTYEEINSETYAFTITVPEIFPCTSIELRFRDSQGNVLIDWTTVSIVSALENTTTITVPPNTTYIDARLYKCCPPSPPDPGDGPCTGDDCVGKPPLLPDDPPCDNIITDKDNDCLLPKRTITDPYIRPTDAGITTIKNEISIPKRVIIDIEHNNCSDIKATLCHPRCADTPTPSGICPCDFHPAVDINSLSQIIIGRQPYGVPFSIDILCRPIPGYKDWQPNFGPEYTSCEIYLSSVYSYATPFIDGVGYDTSLLPRNSWVLVKTTNTVNEMRAWMMNHFRFFTLNNDNTIRFGWPYNDVVWTPGVACIDKLGFTSNPNTVYGYLVPC